MFSSTSLVKGQNVGNIEIDWNNKSKISSENFNLHDECLVECSEIISGGPAKDGIPSIEDPQFYSVQDANQILDNSDKVLGVRIEDVMYLYPHEILDHHEIVNQRINGAIFSITYCPLTGTGIQFNTGGEIGTSGKLYENNLVFYDRDSDSLWSQMYGLAIKGEKMGQTLNFETVIEGNWEVFRKMYPDASVLNRETGYSRDYDSYPYDIYNYKTSRTIIFQSSFNQDEYPDNLYHPKHRTVVIEENGHWGLFPFAVLDGDIPIQVQHESKNVVIFYDRPGELAIAYSYTLNGVDLTFTKTQGGIIDDSLDFGMTVYNDNLGNIWNMKGVAIFGPNQGEKLSQLPSFNAYWFSTVSIYDVFSIYTTNEVYKFSDPIRTDTTYTKAFLGFIPTYGVLFLVLLPIRRRFFDAN